MRKESAAPAAAQPAAAQPAAATAADQLGLGAALGSASVRTKIYVLIRLLLIWRKRAYRDLPLHVTGNIWHCCRRPV